MATITVLALLVAVGLILFSVNPTQSDNQKAIKQAVLSQHAIICAQVQNTANAYRFRSLTPSGEVEPIRHFLTRMQAQRQTLRLARGSKCRSAPGFPPVGLQVKRALHQISEILQHYEPKLRQPISNDPNLSPEGTDKQDSFLPGFEKPPKAGVDENGVPAKLHDELTPSAPTEPLRHHQTQPGAEEAEASPETPEVPKAWAEEDSHAHEPKAEVVTNPPPLVPPVSIELSDEEIAINLGGTTE